MENLKTQGVKYDSDKLRFDLIPTSPMEEIVKVFTMGAMKYKDRNWEKGMKWSRPLAALERHLHSFKSGEDFDQESGLLHLAHVAVNAMFLLQYYKTFPQGDDRALPYHHQPRIGLDIDEVLADFIGHYISKFNENISAESWNFDPLIDERIQHLKDDKEFWLSIPVKTHMRDIPFEPVCYITSRPCPVEWTKEWLSKNGFANVPVFSAHNVSKVEIAKEHKLDWFIDDRYLNFLELNKSGICCFLFDAPHNQRYNVGYKRIKSFRELRQSFSYEGLQPIKSSKMEIVTPPTNVEQQPVVVEKEKDLEVMWQWFDPKIDGWVNVPSPDNEKIEREYKSHLDNQRSGLLVYHCFGDRSTTIIDFDRFQTECGSGKCLMRHKSVWVGYDKYNIIDTRKESDLIDDDHRTFDLRRIVKSKEYGEKIFCLKKN